MQQTKDVAEKRSNSDEASSKGIAVVVPEKFIQAQNPVDIVFKNVSLTVDTKQGQKKILKGIDGICKSGKVNAILGASGAGKTTLLNVLCKRVRTSKGSNIEGDILANTLAYSQSDFSRFAAYVMQDDILLETMTVKECFTFAANLKLKGSQKEKEEKVDLLIKNLRLGKCQNTFVGGLFVKGVSGGEKKRASIGYELISDPAAIFLDEPTSGLDSFTAYSIVDLLKRFAHEQGKTIIFTIHQPSSDTWALFDNIMLMIEGRFIYQGPGGRPIIDHFASIGFKCPTQSNPGDYLMSIMHHESEVNKRNYQVYFDGYDTKLKSIVSQNMSEANTGELPNRISLTSVAYQMGQIALRQARILQRNPILFRARFVQSIIIALFIGAIYWQIPGPNDNPSSRDVGDKNGFMFFFCVGMFMMSLNPCILSFPSQRAVFLREENARLYSVGPYFFAKLFVDLVPAIIFPIISSVITYFMVGMNQDSAGKYFFFMFIMVLQGCIGLALGFFGGSAFSDAKIAIAVTPMLLMPFMLFAGFYKNAADYADWIGWIQYISPFKYSFMAVAINEYHYDNGEYPQKPLNALNFDMSQWASVGLLFVLFGSFTILAFILLSTLKKRIQ